MTEVSELRRPPAKPEGSELRRPPAKPEGSELRRPPAKPESVLSPAAILVVEDSDMQRGMVASTLKSEGYRVLEAENGKRALEELGKQPVQLVITDVEMPEMDGLTLTKAIRADARAQDLPVLMLTTLSGFEEVRAGFDAGASDYLVKPQKGEREIFIEKLVERAQRLLSKRSALPVRRALVVDDSRTTRTMVKAALEGAGFDVCEAEDGLQAQQTLEDASRPLPDLIVTDLEMPVMDGLHFTHAVKGSARTRDVPVVILSASSSNQHRVLSSGFGADAFVSKPFSEEKLLLVVDQVLARSRLEVERRELSRIIGRDVIHAVHNEGLSARRKTLSILFSDISGFSTLCSHKDADGVVDLLNEYFDLFVDFVAREQGYVNKFIGDALMALFSALPGLDPAEVRAARCAVSFQREMRKRNASRAQPLLTRIGINTGEVVMGLIGSGERKDYTVIGDQVNRAQRLEGQCPVGGVLMSMGTYDAATAYLGQQTDLVVKRIDGLKLKGIGEPVSAHAVTFSDNVG